MTQSIEPSLKKSKSSTVRLARLIESTCLPLRSSTFSVALCSSPVSTAA